MSGPPRDGGDAHGEGPCGELPTEVTCVFIRSFSYCDADAYRRCTHCVAHDVCVALPRLAAASARGMRRGRSAICFRLAHFGYLSIRHRALPRISRNLSQGKGVSIGGLRLRHVQLLLVLFMLRIFVFLLLLVASCCGDAFKKNRCWTGAPDSWQVSDSAASRRKISCRAIAVRASPNTTRKWSLRSAWFR